MADTQSESSRQNTERAARLYRELVSSWRDRRPAPRLYSQKAALVFGAVLGLGYGLVTQFVNSIVSPSISFAHHPFGIIGNVGASIAGMMLVCFVCSLPQDTYRGALLGCLVSLLLLEARTLALGATPLIMKLGSQHSLFAVVGIVLELSVLIPVMLALRWTINTQIDRFGEPLWSWERLRVPLGFLAAAVCVGGFLALYPADARHAINNTARLIDRGLAASNTAELPLPLRDESAVHDFLYYREATYTLELGEYTPLDIMLPGCQAI